MRNEVERRLHRAMVKLDKSNIKCSYSADCIEAENCRRCNLYHDKCSKSMKFNSDSH